MNDPAEGAVRGVDGGSPDAAARGAAKVPPVSGAKLSIEVISDAICPWCWVAKRRLERALEALGPEVDADVVWRPFELNPDMPRSGLDRRAYRSRKFGSWERSQALDAQVVAAARSDGLEFRHGRLSGPPTPSTRIVSSGSPGAMIGRTSSSRRCSPPTSIRVATWATPRC